MKGKEKREGLGGERTEGEGRGRNGRAGSRLRLVKNRFSPGGHD